MDQKEALAIISTKTAQAQALITECERIADEAGVSFSFDVAYGMGGSYTPKGQGDRWSSSGWNSSSSMC